MRSLYLLDAARRDSPVAFEPAARPSEVRYALENGAAVGTVKVIKNTFQSHYPALEAAAREAGRDLLDLLVEGDPEIDYRYMGKISTRTKTIYLDDDGRISYNLRFREHLYDADGTRTDSRDQERTPANMNKDVPLVWTGKYFPMAAAVRKFAFSKVYQVRHTNGLTFDFLYAMAAELEKKQALMLMGAGPRGKDPLRLTRGALPYRAFLMGRTRGEAYRLTLHLTNLELKDVT